MPSDVIYVGVLDSPKLSYFADRVQKSARPPAPQMQRGEQRKLMPERSIFLYPIPAISSLGIKEKVGLSVKSLLDLAGSPAGSWLVDSARPPTT